MIGLNAEVFTIKTVVGFILKIDEINGDGIYTEIILIEQNIIVLLQATMIRSKIGYY